MNSFAKGGTVNLASCSLTWSESVASLEYFLIFSEILKIRNENKEFI